MSLGIAYNIVDKANLMHQLNTYPFTYIPISAWELIQYHLMGN